jgi:hypothetical protein
MPACRHVAAGEKEPRQACGLLQFAQFRDMLMEAWRRAMEKPQRVALPPAIPNHTRLGIQ